MLEDYLIVHKSILPDYYDKVISARQMLSEGKARDIKDAAKLVGISRSTYYKYKDYVFEPAELTNDRKAVLTVMLDHQPGRLSALISCISSYGGSILTIDQSLPIRNVASVTVCIETGNLSCRLQDLITAISTIPGTNNPKLIAIE